MKGYILKEFVLKDFLKEGKRSDSRIFDSSLHSHKIEEVEDLIEYCKKKNSKLSTHYRQKSPSKTCWLTLFWTFTQYISNLLVLRDRLQYLEKNT